MFDQTLAYIDQFFAALEQAQPFLTVLLVLIVVVALLYNAISNRNMPRIGGKIGRRAVDAPQAPLPDGFSRVDCREITNFVAADDAESYESLKAFAREGVARRPGLVHVYRVAGCRTRIEIPADTPSYQRIDAAETLALLRELPDLRLIHRLHLRDEPAVLDPWMPKVAGRGESAGLFVLVAVSAATHRATFAVLLELVIVAALFWLIDRKRLPPTRLARGIGALALGAVMVFAADYVVAGRLAWTPGGFALTFGRMLQDGTVKKYLDRHCPYPALRLCAYKDQLPHDADVWFWGSDLFDRHGRFAGLGKEMQKIAVGSVIDYPGLQIETAAAATAKQLIAVHTGEGVLNVIWHTYSIVDRYMPQLVPAMRAARQQKGELSFTAINAFQYPLALLSMALLPVIIWLAWRKTLPAPIGELAATVVLALFGNAVVCGAFANPHDRYGARVIWLATVVIILALAPTRATRLGPPPNSA